ncbi:MAG TPA: hypothetical protein VFW73_09670 [Lacipirellulaceae bacterium]|nr:hypothetical protein [Lacipirellulaceae bacterium]
MYPMESVANHRRSVSAAILVATLVGCAPEAERLRQSIAHPGPAAYQRAEAIQHDPYPLDDVGPEVVGARPREYQIPLNEVERSRLAAGPLGALRPVPAPAAQVAPVPAVPAYPATAVPAALPAATYPAATAPVVVTPPSVVPTPQQMPMPIQRAPY